IAATLIAGPPAGTGWQRLGLAWLLAAGCAAPVPPPPPPVAPNRGHGVGGLKVLCIVYYPPPAARGLRPEAPVAAGALPPHQPAALAWGERSPDTLTLALAGSGIAALVAIVGTRLARRHLLRRTYAG